MEKLQEIRLEIEKIAERPNLTYEAIKQLNELYGAEMCLKGLSGKTDNISMGSEQSQVYTNQAKELREIFPALSKYQQEHNIDNLQNICVEAVQFCNSIFASTRNEEERNIYRKIFEKLSK